MVGLLQSHAFPVSWPGSNGSKGCAAGGGEFHRRSIESRFGAGVGMRVARLAGMVLVSFLAVAAVHAQTSMGEVNGAVTAQRARQFPAHKQDL